MAVVRWFEAGLIALTLATVPTSVGAQAVKTGISAWQKGDYEGAVASWRPLASKGDADAAFNLGQAYRLGKGVPLNLASAQSWYEVAARKGHIDAATSLGILLFQNGNRTGAMRWLKQAADSGEPRAALLYGTALYNGDGIKPDPVMAYAYVSRAAAAGLAPARATLADMNSMMPLAQRQRGVAVAQSVVEGKKGKPVAVQSAPKPVAVATKLAPPAPVNASNGSWRVQLGAFGKRASAETLFAKLSRGALSGRQAYYVPVGAMTRLQAGPFASKAEAAVACARLNGLACFPVK